MSYFLGIETSFNNTGVCLMKDDYSLLEISSYTEGRHQENLFSLIESAFKHFNIQPRDLAGIGVTIGPGMFTSLRVGLAAAKSLALPHKTPVKGVDTFSGLAQTFYDLFLEEGILVPVIDARRNQIYAVVYKKKERITEPLLLSPEEVAEKYKEGTFIGSGLKSYPLAFKNNKKMNIYFPSPTVVCRLAKEAISRQEVDDVEELVPFYLKSPEIRGKR